MLSTKLPTIWQLYCTYSKINHFHETISGKTVDKLIQRCQPPRINQIPTKTKRTTPRCQSQDTTRQKTPHNSFKLSHVEFLTRWRPQTNSETPHTWSQLKSNQPTMTNTPRPTRPLPYIQATGRKQNDFKSQQQTYMQHERLNLCHIPLATYTTTKNIKLCGYDTFLQINKYEMYIQKNYVRNYIWAT